jgi:hypothetical protein
LQHAILKYARLEGYLAVVIVVIYILLIVVDYLRAREETFA